MIQMTKRGAALASVGSLATFMSFAQVDEQALRYAGTITAAELKEHLTTLASDAFQGRDTGKEGQKLAAAYLRDQFVKSGIPPLPITDSTIVTDGYFQPYELIEVRSGGIRIETEIRTLEFMRVLVYFNEVLKADVSITRAVFLGTRVDASRAALRGAVVLLDASGFGEGASALGPLRGRIDQCKAAGASLVLVSVPSSAKMMEGLHVGGTRLRLPDGDRKTDQGGSVVQTIFVDEAAMNTLLGRTSIAKLARRKRAREVSLRCDIKVSQMEQRIVCCSAIGYATPARSHSISKGSH